MCRVVCREHANLRAFSTDVRHAADAVASLKSIPSTAEAEVAISSCVRYVARLRTCPKMLDATFSIVTHAITGGLGGLGLSAAVFLVEGGQVVRVLLASRSGQAVRDGQGNIL